MDVQNSSRRRRLAFLPAMATLAACALPGGARSQEASAVPAVERQLAEADAIAGDDPLLHILRNYHCYYVDPAPAPFRPEVMDETDFLFGTPILDNVTYLGYLNLAVFAIETSDGLVLIDAGATPAQGERILAWLDKSGHARSDVKWIILTHEHFDHVGGAEVLHAGTGARIAAGPGALHSEAGSIPASLQPVDLLVKDRTDLQVGDTRFVLLPTPGHTPGTLSVFAPVKVDQKQHMASFWGGKGMRPNVANLRTMLQSVDHFARVSQELGADVPLNTHSWGDGTVSRLIDKVLAPELPNPFLLTEGQNAANLALLRLCTSAYLDKVQAGQQPR